jgi:hypothetical protein
MAPQGRWIRTVLVTAALLAVLALIVIGIVRIWQT